MFALGIMVMGMSVAGLVALAFMQARFPHVLESLLEPIEDKSILNEENPLAEGLAEGAPAAEAAPQAPEEAATQEAQPEEEVENINIDEVPVNSVNMTNMTSARQIK